eukprot:jgi/Mesvir1/15900/Mv02803-RA.1
MDEEVYHSSLTRSRGTEVSEDESEEDEITKDSDEFLGGSDYDTDGYGSDTTTAAQAKKGKDIQGIKWERLNYNRSTYRTQRLDQYKNYENLNFKRVDKEGNVERTPGCLYDFFYNTRKVRSQIVHFQLRNLVWATSKHDVYVMFESGIQHWSPVTGKLTEVMSLLNGRPGSALGRVQISTMCAYRNLIVAGGFLGEMVVKCVDVPGLLFCDHITRDDNAITNAVEIFEACSGAQRVVTSNNDCFVRVFDASACSLSLISKFAFPWAVNHTSVSPDGRLFCIVGDDTNALVADSRTGAVVATLRGHLDFSFASAWHPGGHMFATGNQDATCRLWDIRWPGTSLDILRGKIGAIRSLRFSTDGKYLAAAEPVDFVVLYDVASGFQRCQEIDLFGEVSGISFSPDAEALFVGVADRKFSSLLEYHARHDDTFAQPFV